MAPPASSDSAFIDLLGDTQDPALTSKHLGGPPLRTVSHSPASSPMKQSAPSHSSHGLQDPFDELAGGYSSSSRSGQPPPMAPDCSHGPLALDPLAALWQDPADEPPLTVATDNQPSISRLSASSQNNHNDPSQWDLSDLVPPAASNAHSSTQGARGQQQPDNNSPDLLGDASVGGASQVHPRFAHHSPHRSGSKTPQPSASGAAPRHAAPRLSESAPTSRPGSPEREQGSREAAEGQTGGAFDDKGADEQRELFIYALPLSKEKLVFLPIAGWKEEPKPPPPAGTLSAGMQRLTESVNSIWNSMGTKDPASFQHKIYQHGQQVLENMSAEERLMRYIPKAATKVVVYHPTTISPSEVQEELQKMTSSFMVKATGKAAAAGLLLPVAVGIEIIAVPGTGWYALYQLYKASTSAQGVSRLSEYLNHAKDVRVCYAGMEKLDQYVERARLSPDGLLTQDDVDDLCHELGEPALQHPLTELRNRYAKRVLSGDYALLPAKDATDDGEAMGSATGQSTPPEQASRYSLSGWAAQLQFWK